MGRWSHTLCRELLVMGYQQETSKYKIVLSLNKTTYDIDTAKCGCKAGKGPKASCKHVRALCYAFTEFCKSGRPPGFLTCTQKLQDWNRPRPRKVEVIPVLDLGYRRQKLTKNREKTRPVPV